jgi:ribokinase
MKNILVVGSLNMDFVINTDTMPKPGETIFGKNFSLVPGGKGANQAYAIAKLGGKVAMIGGIGTDAYGEMLIDNLNSVGVSTEFVKRIPETDTGRAFITVDKTGENSIVVIRGANYLLDTAWLDTNEHLFDECDAVVIQLEIPLKVVDYAARLAKKKGKIVILDPAPATEKIMADTCLENVDIIKPNETELEVLTGLPVNTEENIKTAAQKLINKGVGTVIVTMGEKGSLLVQKNYVKHFPAKKVKAVDTTAAGDCFTAAVALMLDKDNYDEAIRFAAKASALAVTKKGAQSSIPNKREIDEME